MAAETGAEAKRERGVFFHTGKRALKEKGERRGEQEEPAWHARGDFLYGWGRHHGAMRD